MFGEVDQRLFELAAQEAGDSLGVENIGGKRSVQSIRAEMRRGIDPANGLEQFQGQARGRVHRHIECNQGRLANRGFIQRIARKVLAGNRVAALAQPRRRRSQPKRLPSQFVRRNQDDLHDVSL